MKDGDATFEYNWIWLANTLQEPTVYVLISLTMRIISQVIQPIWQRLVHTST